MSQPKLCIFDLDGTLVNTLQDIAHAVNQVLQQLVLPTLTLSQIEQNIGQGARWLLSQSLRAAGDTEASLLPEARARFLPTYADHLTDQSRPYPGVCDTLQQLQQNGHTLTVCTNKPIDLAKQMLHDLGLEPFFQEVLGGDSLAERKPHPLPLLHLMKQFSFTPKNTMMFGDRIYDIQAGRAAQTWTCGIAHDNVNLAQLQDADVVLHSFPPILDLEFLGR